MTIPLEAMPIVEKIRKEVPRPPVLPKFWPGTVEKLRFLPDFAPSARVGGLCCPMGLLPEALNSTPVRAFQIGLPYASVYSADDKAVQAFYQWWDKQKDAEAAVNTVWGEK